MLNKISSREGQWFLNNLQEAQDNLAKKLKANIVIVNSKGILVTKASSFSDFCHLLAENFPEKGGCLSLTQYAINLMSKKEEAVFTNNYNSLASFWVSLKDEKGKVVGAIAGCGGWYDYGMTTVEEEKSLEDFYQELGFNKEKCSFSKFLSAIKEMPIITKDELRKEAFLLAKLVEVLIKETDLKQVFQANHYSKK